MSLSLSLSNLLTVLQSLIFVNSINIGQTIYKLLLEPILSELWPNDIALVKASKDLPLGVAGRHIDAIKLPETEIQNWPLVGSNCTVKGWGCTYKG